MHGLKILRKYLMSVLSSNIVSIGQGKIFKYDFFASYSGIINKSNNIILIQKSKSKNFLVTSSGKVLFIRHNIKTSRVEWP